MVRIARSIAAAFCLAAITAGITSCSLIGYSIGSAIDNNSSIDESRDYPATAIADLSTGDSVGLELVGGQYMRGRYMSFNLQDSVAYYRKCTMYNEMSGLPGGFPLPGDSVLIKAHRDKEPLRIVGSFARYDSVNIWRYRMHGDIWPTALSWIDTVFFRDGEIVTGAWLRAASAERRLPTISGVATVQSAGQVVEVTTDSIKAVHRAGMGSGGVTGLVIGIAVDVAIIVAAIVVSSQMSFGGSFLKPVHLPSGSGDF